MVIKIMTFREIVMQKQTTPNNGNSLKKLDFVSWQFRHALKEHRNAETNRLISSKMHEEAPVHAN
jgi:hypothetical protein